MPETPERTALYRFFAEDDSLLYVGIAYDPDARQRQHAKSASDTWWPLAARRTDEWFEAREAADRAEIEAIAKERPRFNVRDNPHLSEDVTKVRQRRAARSELLPHQGPFTRYYQVAEAIRRKIDTGELPPGAKVPNPVYAREFGVGIETVKRACESLVDAGLLDRRHSVPWPMPDEGVVKIPVDRPEEAAAILSGVMTDEQLAAFVAALWMTKRRPVSEVE
jgi:predicted GIY-YIG superfamily endonuclease